MATCNVIFWSIVVPTIIYGCELWVLDDPTLNMIEEFQNNIGKRVQRSHPKIPSVCSYYGLGWMRLERIIQIRKLMFIHTILIMDENSLSKNFFVDTLTYTFLMILLMPRMFLTVWYLIYSMSVPYSAC